jgi:hypothetical protein
MDTMTMWAATERVRRLKDEAARDRRAAECAAPGTGLLRRLAERLADRGRRSAAALGRRDHPEAAPRAA